MIIFVQKPVHPEDLFLFGRSRIYPAKSFPEILSLIFLEELLLEIRPIELGVIFIVHNV